MTDKLSGASGAETGAFESVREGREAIEARYVDADTVDHALDLQPLFADRFASIHDERRLRTRADRLAELSGAVADRSPCAVVFDDLRQGIEAVDPAATANRAARAYYAFYENSLALAGVVSDAALLYPDLDCSDAVARLNEALERGQRGNLEAGTDRLLDATESVYALATVVRQGHDLWATVAEQSYAHPDDSPASVRDAIREVITTGSPERMATLAGDLKRVVAGEWVRSDLMAFDPYEFEQLVADLWAERENTTAVTQASQDRGIDVIVRRPNDRTLVIQAKRYQPGNTVGIDEVQRTAGLLVEFPAAKAVLVTSSSFTSAARESGESMDRVVLVDGETLVDLLTKSTLAPPTEL